MEVNKFIAKCEDIKSGKTTIEELVSEYFIDKYVSIDVKAFVARWVEDSVLIKIGYNSTENKQHFLTMLCADGLEEVNGDIMTDYEIARTLLVLNQYLSADFYPFDTYAYDILHDIRIIDYIDKLTNGDYKRFCDFVDNITGIYNYSTVKATLKALEAVPSKEEVNGLVDALNGIDPETIKGLVSLVEFNDTETTELLKKVKNGIASGEIRDAEPKPKKKTKKAVTE